MAKKGLLYNLRRKIQVMLYDVTSPEFVSKLYFKKLLGYNLDLKNPKTFNEKIQWLKLYEWPNNELAIKCADKYDVREYLEKKNMGEYLNDLIGVWDNVDDIDFDKLPNQFALKCTHGCAYNIIVDDKKMLNIPETKVQLKKWMKEDFGKFNAEPHYSKMKPKIVCEKYLGGDITDYKFYFFNGEYEFMYIATGFGKGEDERITMFDKNGEIAPFRRTDYDIVAVATLPKHYKKMLELSKELAKDFVFVRVDWFEENNKIYFGELTFTPCGGLMRIDPIKYDAILGERLKINGEKNGKKN